MLKNLQVPALLIISALICSNYYFSTLFAMSETELRDCIFCNIVNKVEVTEILFEDDDVTVFRDIKPASRFHILTVPKRHIKDAKSLTATDKALVEKMLTVSKGMLLKNNLSETDVRFGFHWPPCISVHHLHLHTIAPETEMGWLSRIVFMKNSLWFVSPEYVLSRL